jgi:hypothetical protein
MYLLVRQILTRFHRSVLAGPTGMPVMERRLLHQTPPPIDALVVVAGWRLI